MVDKHLRHHQKLVCARSSECDNEKLRNVRVATNLENLEHSLISLNVDNSGNSVQPYGKIVTNKVFLVHHSNICVKQLLTG